MELSVIGPQKIKMELFGPGPIVLDVITPPFVMCTNRWSISVGIRKAGSTPLNLFTNVFYDSQVISIGNEEYCLNMIWGKQIDKTTNKEST